MSAALFCATFYFQGELTSGKSCSPERKTTQFLIPNVYVPERNQDESFTVADSLSGR